MSRRRRKHRERRARHEAPPQRELEHSSGAARDDLVEAPAVRRLAYTRRQAAEALGVSVRTIERRVVPEIETVKTEWGVRLIPVSELERYLEERKEASNPRRTKPRSTGRPATVPDEIVERIRSEYERGKSLGQIARDLNERGAPTAQGGTRWWPSTVRGILIRGGR